MAGQLRITTSHVVALLVAVAVLGVISVAGFTMVYQGKIYPGVSVDGLYLGGLDRTAAAQALQNEATQYAGEQLTVKYAGTSLTIPIKGLGVKYTGTGVTAALDYGRSGSFAGQLRDRLRSLLGRSATYADYTYNDSVLTPSVDSVDSAVNQPVANAALSFSNGQVVATVSQPGQRLDRGLLVQAIEAQLGSMNIQPITAPVYALAPSITQEDLSTATSQANRYVTAPLDLTAGTAHQTISQAQILAWLNVSAASSVSDLPLNPLQSFYPNATAGPAVHVTLDTTRVASFVASFAAGLNQAPKDAVLTWQNNAVAIAQPSQPGLALDQTKANQQILAALNQPGSSRSLSLPTAETQAPVNESNLASLGITSQISEGQTTFPGSSAARITNVTVGAKQFNDVLLSPGEEFSFGQILGPVGAAQGYLPGLVILGNSETYQYGGGLCQVATTAFRAALLAGLPINQRSNHSYAVSFYTAPYGVPGVDATIYYPQVDLKFTNDTGHYILIQTSISGDQLTFDYYGTKTKTGVIIPPHFIYGTTDAAQPSETQFQRQVLDLSGNVVKTDTFTQYYQSSTDFPIEQTSNGA